MNDYQRPPHLRHLKQGVSRVLAILMTLVLALAGSVSVAATAQAAAGTINSLTLTTVYDGAQVPNDLDDGANNGIVASNDVVGFRWDLNATDLEEGVFTQTLPEGWTWDESSLTSLDSNSSAYQANYVLTDNGRTLTATISVGNGSGNPSVVGFGTLKAIPSGDVANESVYDPAVIATVNDDEITAEADPITVRNTPRADVVKTRGANNRLSTYDFGDGHGEVAARYIDFPITITDAVGTIGARNIELQQPLVLQDSFEISAPAGYEDVQFAAVIVSKSEASAEATISAPSSNGFTLTLDEFTSLPDASVTVRMWVRDSDVPTDSLGNIKVVNTVTPVDWRDVTGDAVTEDSTNNKAEGTVQKPPTYGAIHRAKNIYLFNDQEADTSVVADPARAGQPFTNVNEQEISQGSKIVARFDVRAAVDNTSNLVTGASNLVAYDFWSVDEQQIIAGSDIFVGSSQATSSLDESDYTVRYTSGTDSGNPENNTWVDSISAAGGAQAVTGIRVEYTSGVWKDNAPNNADAFFTVAVPFEVVAEVGTRANDTAKWSFTDHAGAPQAPSVNQFVNVGNYRLGLDKTAGRSSVVSGSDISYTLAPTVTRPRGAITDVTVQGLTIVDKLPEGLVSVDTSSVTAPWSVTRSGNPDTGLVLTFAYDGPVETGTSLPEINYDVTTSVQAPVDSVLVNTAVITADGTTQSESSRTASETVTVYQAEVITEEKVVVGEDQIEVGDPRVSWETRWFNFQTVSQGESFFVDVLPYNGDARGTQFNGTAKLASARITDGAGNPARSGYGTLQYTTAPATDVYAVEANDTSIVWTDVNGSDLSEISGITALRVIVHDFENGQDGVGGLLVTLDVEGQKKGDVYVNNTTGWLGVNGKLGRSNDAEITVTGSSIAGVVWQDLNADGVRDGSEPTLSGVTVDLLDGNGDVVKSVQTEADGSYLFDQLHSGNYATRVDTSTLGFAANYVVTNTYDLDGNTNSHSGDITLPKTTDIEDVDYGYVVKVSDIDLEKSGKLSGEAKAGEWVEWDFTITNMGENTLTAIELTDHLAGVVDLVVDWPGDAGVLEASQSAPASARYQLTQDDIDRGYVHNTATVTGLDPNDTEVEDPADATVTLPEGGSLSFKKTGALEGEAVLGAEVVWTFVITNTGNVTIDDVAVNDELQGLSDIVFGDWPSAQNVLKPGESVEAEASYALTQADLDLQCVSNTASAQGQTPGDVLVPSNKDTAQVCFTSESSISLIKKTNGVEYDSAPGAELKVGDSVEWTYEITNTGRTTLTDVVLIDDQEGTISAPAEFDGSLKPGESVTYTATGTAVQGLYHNTAVVEAKNPQKDSVTAEDESWYSAETSDGNLDDGNEKEGDDKTSEPDSSQDTGDEQLSQTGAQVAGFALLGIVLLGGGVSLLLMRRRRA